MLPFVGPSYVLATLKASVQRSVNLYLVGMETPSKAPFIMDSVPGLAVFCTLGAPVRGVFKTNDRAFAVAGQALYEINADGTFESRGQLATSTGPVEIEYGLFQLVIVDGTHGYVLTLADNTFQQITTDGFYGSSTVGFIANYFAFIRPDSGQFEVSAINDATSVDALNFASAESSPDNLVGLIVDHADLWLFGTLTTEIWAPSGQLDFPLAKRQGVDIEVGLSAVHSVRKIDSTILWIGQDRNGSGIVYRSNVYQQLRISTQAVEQALQASTDLSQARAYCYQEKGLSFYCINAPGLDTTWCYEISTGQWAERADLNPIGQYMAHRGTCHTFAFGMHLIGSDDGNLYRLDRKLYTNSGDPLVRERTSPHGAAPGLNNLFFNKLVLDCTTGEADQGIDTQVELSYSNNSGATWSNPLIRSIGKVGEYFARLVWNRLGFARDRVWRIRYSGNAPFSIINVEVNPGEAKT